MGELKGATLPYFSKLILLAYAGCFVFYLGVGMVGYNFFGPTLKYGSANIMKSFNGSGFQAKVEWPLHVAGWLLAFNVITKFPTLLMSCHQCILDIMAQLSNFPELSNFRNTSWRFHRFLIAIPAIMIACFDPKISTIITMNVALTISPIVFIMPTIILGKLEGSFTKHKIPILMSLFGIMTSSVLIWTMTTPKSEPMVP